MLTEFEGVEIDGADRAPGQTVREGAPTTREPRPAANATRLEPRAADPDDDGVALLPPALRARYTVDRELRRGGSEADLVLVRDHEDRPFVAKVYRGGITLDRGVCDRLRQVDPRYVIGQLELGHSAGRDYEILEYAGPGDLRMLIERRGGRFPVPEVTEIARQLAAALTAIHAVDIVHRDLKPENVLLRDDRPLALVLADFGVSRKLSGTVRFTTVAHTPAYAAPESINGEASRPGDWWSLGMIVRELATGRDLFAGIGRQAIYGHLISRPISVDEVSDARLRLLCRGLLVKDQRSRWGASEVGAWLAGGSPPVPEDRIAVRPLYFAERELHTKREAADAVVGHWSDACDRFFPGRGTSEGLRTLADWMRQFEDSSAAADERVALVDGSLSGDLDPNIKLLLLLRWLDRDRPPVLRGQPVTVASVRRLADAATDPAAAQHRQARAELDFYWSCGVLRYLAEFEGGGALAELDRAWRELGRQWDAWAGAIIARRDVYSDGIAPVDDDIEVRHLLLDAVARPQARPASITGQAEELRARLGPRVPWFARLGRETAGGGVLRELSIVVLGRLATEEVARLDLANRRAAAQLAARQRQWRDLEAHRLSAAGRLRGVLAAIGGALLFCAVVTAVASIGLDYDRTGQTGPVLAIVIGAVSASEVAVGATLGRSYHPRYSLLPIVWRGLNGARLRLAAVFTALGRSGCLGLLVLCCCGGYGLSLLPWAAAGASLAAAIPYLVGAAGLAYVGWSLVRLRSWSVEHGEHRQRTLGA